MWSWLRPMIIVFAKPGLDHLLARGLVDRDRLAVVARHRLDGAGRAPPARAGQRGPDVGQLQHAGGVTPERERGLLWSLVTSAIDWWCAAGVRVHERGRRQRLHAQPHRHVHHVRDTGELLSLMNAVFGEVASASSATCARRSRPRSAPGSAGRRRRGRSVMRSGRADRELVVDAQALLQRRGRGEDLVGGTGAQVDRLVRQAVAGLQLSPSRPNTRLEAIARTRCLSGPGCTSAIDIGDVRRVRAPRFSESLTWPARWGRAWS